MSSDKVPSFDRLITQSRQLHDTFKSCEYEKLKKEIISHITDLSKSYHNNKDRMRRFFIQTMFLEQFRYGKHFREAFVKLCREDKKKLLCYLQLWRDSLNNNYYNKFGRGGSEIKSEKEVKNGVYKYIPAYPERFLDRILLSNRVFQRDSFIDVGSGTGSKVFLASMFGNFERLYGIEINDTTFRISKELSEEAFRDENIILQHGDALEHNYEKYNFIYMYTPMYNFNMLSKLYERIMRTAPNGAIIVEFDWRTSALNKAMKRIGAEIVRAKKYGMFLHKHTRTKFSYQRGGSLYTNIKGEWL